MERNAKNYYFYIIRGEDKEEFYPLEYDDMTSCDITSEKSSMLLQKHERMYDVTKFNLHGKKEISLLITADSFADEFCTRLNRTVKEQFKNN